MIDFKGRAKTVLESDRTSSGILTAMIIAVVMVVNALLYTLVQTFGWQITYIDEYDYSLSGATDELFASAIEQNKKVKISFCMAEDEVKVHSTGAEVYITAKNLAERYEGFIELDFINITTKQDQHGNLVSLSKYQTDMEGNKTKILKSSVIFSCGEGDREVYRVVTDSATSAGFATFFNLDSSMYAISYNGEEIFAAMISWVTAETHKKAYFTQYHGETADSSFATLLACAGYYVDFVDLRQNAVPEDADLLIVSNPKNDFEAARPGVNVSTEIDRLEAYLERGGNLLVTLDPYVKTLPILEGILSKYGIEFSTTTTPAGASVRNMVKESTNAITTDGFTFVAEYGNNELGDMVSGSIKSGGSVVVREVSALELFGDAKPLLVSSPSSNLEANGSVVSDGGSYVIAAYASKDYGNGQTARVLVIPSIYIAVSDALVANGYSNKDFFYATFEHFYGAEGMPYGCKPVIYSSSTLENLTMGMARLYTAITLAIPLAIAAVGTVVIVRRRNR